MGNVHGDFEKLFSSSEVIHGLLSSSIHDSFSSVINEANSNLARISELHDYFLNTIDFSMLLNQQDDIYQKIGTLENKIFSSIDSLMNYYIDIEKMSVFDVMKMLPSTSFYSAVSGLLKDSNIPLSELVSKEVLQAGYDYNYYNSLLKNYTSSITNHRDKTVAYALFLATILPRISYYFGGGHGSLVCDGLDPNWGTPKGKGKTYSYDCSSLVNWCFKNANTDADFGKDFINWTVADYDGSKIGEKISLTDENACDILKPGDLAMMRKKDNHIGIVVDVNKDDHTVTVVHCSGSGKGINITKTNVLTGKVVDDSSECAKSRIASGKYFESWIHLNYADEC